VRGEEGLLLGAELFGRVTHGLAIVRPSMDD
jgi:hypothetical protein